MPIVIHPPDIYTIQLVSCSVVTFLHFLDFLWLSQVLTPHIYFLQSAVSNAPGYNSMCIFVTTTEVQTTDTSSDKWKIKCKRKQKYELSDTCMLLLSKLWSLAFVKIRLLWSFLKVSELLTPVEDDLRATYLFCKSQTLRFVSEFLMTVEDGQLS